MNFDELPDLASRAMGGGVVFANDEFFAAADNLVTPGPPGFTPHTFGPKGQVYDGWETRRRREPGHDHAIVRLGVPGVVRGVVIDTSHFTGNFPPHASVEGHTVDDPVLPSPAELADREWVTLVPHAALGGDARYLFPVRDESVYSHVRLSIYPDGGVARLRVHGEARPNPRLVPDGLLDLAAAEYGGVVADWSDRFYGAPQNLLLPGLAQVMGEGWETRRRRDAGNDWVLVRLAWPGVLHLAELDTSHFKGNAPGWASLRGSRSDVDGSWAELMPRTRLQPDTRQRIPIEPGPPVTHVRMDVFPDGGMARLRLYGTRAGA